MIRFSAIIIATYVAFLNWRFAMSYEQNSKLYPDYRAGEGPQYHNDDSFFYFWSPEELREFLTEENISDVTIYKNIGNKNIPFILLLYIVVGSLT